MRALVARTVIAAWLCAWGTLAVAAAPTEALDNFHAAMKKKDGAKVLALLAPEATIYEQGFAETSRDQWKEHQLAEALDFAANTERRTLRRESKQVGDVAYVMTTTLTTGSFDDRKLELEGAETAVLRQENGVWRIVHLHWSAHEKAPDAPPPAK